MRTPLDHHLPEISSFSSFASFLDSSLQIGPISQIAGLNIRFWSYSQMCAWDHHRTTECLKTELLAHQDCHLKF